MSCTINMIWSVKDPNTFQFNPPTFFSSKFMLWLKILLFFSSLSIQFTSTWHSSILLCILQLLITNNFEKIFKIYVFKGFQGHFLNTSSIWCIIYKAAITNILLFILNLSMKIDNRGLKQNKHCQILSSLFHKMDSLLINFNQISV